MFCLRPFHAIPYLRMYTHESRAGGSEAVTEEEVLAWANATVRDAPSSGHAAPPCASFRCEPGSFLFNYVFSYMCASTPQGTAPPFADFY